MSEIFINSYYNSYLFNEYPTSVRAIAVTPPRLTFLSFSDYFTVLLYERVRTGLYVL